MCALACLAEFPIASMPFDLVKRLFVIKDYNPEGLYVVKFCKNGEWCPITIDDFFPCKPFGGPIYSSGHGPELWVLMLEKAYAKIHGSYDSLRGGHCHEAFSDLTGFPTERF